MTETHTEHAEQMGPGPLEGLRTRLRGEVLAPGDDGYDKARQAWNLNAEHRPALVVLAEDASDVRSAVRFAKASGLAVGVLATGHGTGQPCNGGLLINTSRMRGVRVDPSARVARVEAGAIWEDVVKAAATHGLVGLAGSSMTVGVVGYTLGGGFGWLGRRYGLAAHSITKAEVVTADGQFLTASPNEHPDLFWGLQGGTGNLGIVTSLEFGLHPLREVYAGNLYYPLERARDVLEFYAEWSRKAPDELTAATTFRTFPPLPSVPDPMRGRTLVALRGCFSGDPAAGEALINQARAALGSAVADTFDVMPASALSAISMDPVEPLPVLNHTELLRDLTPAAIDVLVDLVGPDSQSPLVMLELRQIGGALMGPAGALSSMAHAGAAYTVNAIGITPTPAQAAAVRIHLERLETNLRPHVTGNTYLNFLDLEGATPPRIRASFSREDWERLTGLKATYDPHNVFRFNRNIPLVDSDSDRFDNNQPAQEVSTQ